MQRIGTVDGLYIDGNQMTNMKGTIATAAWLNALQEEIARAIEGLGGTLNSSDNEQLLAALLELHADASRNRIINGDMQIDQRKAGAAHTLSAGAWTYCLDRMIAYCTGAGTTAQQVNGATAGQKLCQINGGSGVTALGFGQRIESINIGDMAGQIVTLSMLIADSLGSACTWYAHYANTADTFTAVTEIAHGTFAPTSSLQQFSAQITLPAQAINGVSFTIQTGAHNSGSITVGDLQVRKGVISGDIPKRINPIEQICCEQYFRWLPFNMRFSSTGANDSIVTPVAFPRMRVAPTISAIAADPFSAGGQSNANNSINEFNRTTPDGCAAQLTATAAGSTYIYGYRASLTAEL